MNGWIIRGAAQEQRIAVEPCCMNTDVPLLHLHAIGFRNASAVLLGVDEVVELKSALDEFLALTNQPKDKA